MQKHDKVHYLEDPELSFKEKGLMAYLLSRSEEWKYNLDKIIDASLDGPTAVETGIRALKSKGYLFLTRIIKPGYGRRWTMSLNEYKQAPRITVQSPN